MASTTIKIFYVTKKVIGGEFFKKEERIHFSVHTKGLHGKVVLTFRNHAKRPVYYLVGRNHGNKNKKQGDVLQVYFDLNGTGVASYINSCS